MEDHIGVGDLEEICVRHVVTFEECGVSSFWQGQYEHAEWGGDSGGHGSDRGDL